MNKVFTIFISLSLLTSSCSSHKNNIFLKKSKLIYTTRTGTNEIRRIAGSYGKDVKHGPFISLDNGVVTFMCGFIHGESRPGEFHFFKSGKLRSATIRLNDEIDYLFSYDVNGDETGQIIIKNGKPYHGVLHDWMFGLNGEKWSKLLYYEKGKLIKEIECDPIQLWKLDVPPLENHLIPDGEAKPSPDGKQKLDE